MDDAGVRCTDKTRRTHSERRRGTDSAVAGGVRGREVRSRREDMMLTDIVLLLSCSS